jgi:hypothetical protein
LSIHRPPPVSEQRLSLTRNGMVRYELKRPYRDGATHVSAPAHPCACGISASMHVIFEPLDFISKLAALVPKPRVNLTRFHALFARRGLPPNSKHRAQVTPGKRGKGWKFNATDYSQDKSPEECRASMTWAQRLKRVFDMDVEICDQRGGCIGDPMVIKKILDHMNSTSAVSKKKRLPQSPAPPQGCLFN